MSMRGRPNVNPVLQYMRDDDVAYDPFGTAMSWAFAVASVLTLFSEQVPTALGYRPAAGGVTKDIVLEDYPESTLYADYMNGEISLTELQHAAVLLSRYLDWCKLAGRDY